MLFGPASMGVRYFCNAVRADKPAFDYVERDRATCTTLVMHVRAEHLKEFVLMLAGEFLFTLE